MSAYDEERIADLLRLLKPAPEAWARAARVRIWAPTSSAVVGSSGSTSSTRRDRALPMILLARARAESCSGIPCSAEVRPFSAALRCSQV